MHGMHLEECQKTRPDRSRKRRSKNLGVVWLCVFALLFSVTTVQADLTTNQDFRDRILASLEYRQHARDFGVLESSGSFDGRKAT